MYVYLQQLLLLSFILIYIFLRGHCSINPCFWEGVDVACQSFLLSSCIALSFHTTRKNYATLIHSFGRGLILYIYIYTFFSFKNLSYHPSLLCQSMLLGGGGCRMPNFSFIILHWSFHTTREELFNHSTLIHSFGRGLILYIYIYIYLFIFQEYLLSSFIALSIHAFGRGWMLHVRVFFYHPALLCLPY